MSAYHRLRRERAVAAGHCSVCCKQPRSGAYSMCENCLERKRDQQGFQAAYKPRHGQRSLADYYEPIDQILAKPPVRLLRALRWFDWISVAELLSALDMDDQEIDQARTRAALSRLVGLGQVERGGHDYRITPVGRAELRDRLDRYEQSIRRAA